MSSKLISSQIKYWVKYKDGANWYYWKLDRDRQSLLAAVNEKRHATLFTKEEMLKHVRNCGSKFPVDIFPVLEEVTQTTTLKELS